ncbi:hypothetical protein ACFYWX_29880 [Streptomyces sp. NPDC002888]|uniref:hypothetical protein n=1 Tax=Streptomyces sp. NPDC002888 TaxID=3364668 RepID=UPI003677F8D7
MSTNGNLNPNSQVPVPVEVKEVVAPPEELGSVHRNGDEIIWIAGDSQQSWRPEVVDGGGDHYVRIRKGEKFQRLDGSPQQLARLRARHERRMEAWKFLTQAGVSLLIFAGLVFGGPLGVPPEAQPVLYVAAGTAGTWVYKTQRRK